MIAHIKVQGIKDPIGTAEVHSKTDLDNFLLAYGLIVDFSCMAEDLKWDSVTYFKGED